MIEIYQPLILAFLGSWVFGFVLGSKVRMFKQATESLT